MSILTTSENKFDFFNVRFPSIKAFGTSQLQAFWLPTDVSYAEDRKTFETLDENAKHMLKNVIGFFFSSDGIVFSNIGTNFQDEIKCQEAQYTYSSINLIELIHAESYGLQLDAIIEDPAEKVKLMNSIVNIPSIKRLADWAIKYTDREQFTLIERLYAFLLIEGVFFSSPFSIIFYIRHHYPGVVSGIVSANDLISRDENLHCEFAVHLINTLQEKEGWKTDRGIEIFKSAVDVSIEFVKDTLPNDMLDMNVGLMSRHIKSVANRWGTLIGLPLVYPDCKQTPFKFMESLSLEVKKNFFEKTATEYQKAPSMTLSFNPDVLESEEW